MVYEKNDYLNRKIWNHKKIWHLVENKTDYVACLQNAVNFIIV